MTTSRRRRASIVSQLPQEEFQQYFAKLEQASPPREHRLRGQVTSRADREGMKVPCGLPRREQAAPNNDYVLKSQARGVQKM